MVRPDSPGITVLLAVRDGADLVCTAIDSILGRTFSDFELIIVDDGSSDATPGVLAACADPRLRMLTKPLNLGVLAARTRGLAGCRGTYVAVLDHDDRSAADRLARQIGYLDAHAGTVGTVTRIDEPGRLRPREENRPTTALLIR